MKALYVWKSGVAVTLIGTLILSACGQEAKEPAGGATDNKGKQEASGGKEKLELSWFINAPANTNLPDRDKDFVLQTIEKKFNVDLKVTYMAPADYNTKLNALLSSTPPDMWRDMNGDGGNKYAVDGLLADLTPFIKPATMPNYFKYWTNEDELKRYQIQGGFFRAPLPYLKQSYRTYYIRKDWLDKLNLSIPTTYDEYVKVLKAFTVSDPDGNGKADTYGFTTAGGGANLGYDWPEIYKHGLKFPSFIENNQWQDPTLSPSMQNVLDDIAKLMSEGVIDPDWYLNKSPQHVEKAISGKIGVIMGSTKDFAFDNVPTSIQYRTKQINPKADWRPFTMVGSNPTMVTLGPSNPFLFPKTVAEKNPQKIVRTVEILDWLASEEGYLLTHYGQEGKHYTRDGKSIKPNVEAYNQDIAKQGDFLRIWSFFTQETLQPEVYGLTVVDTRETDRDRSILQFLNAQPKNTYIGTSLTPPAGFDLAGFRKRQNELFSKAVFEDKSGKNWPMYREELLTKYKGAELIQKYNADLKAAGVIK